MAPVIGRAVMQGEPNRMPKSVMLMADVDKASIVLDEVIEKGVGESGERVGRTRRAMACYRREWP